MNNGLYSRLAISNIKNNRRLFVPYILSCVCTVAMFYIMTFLNFHEAFYGRSVGVVLGLGCIVIGIFAVIIVLYTNSFLMKRRKRELGLYNILGMEKKHIARIMALESLYVSLISIILGLGLGVLFSKLMQLLLSRLLQLSVPIGFEVSVTGFIVTAALFFAIFLAAFILNAARVQLSRPIELFKGSEVGEREPRVKWLLVVVGVLTLGTGYAIAVTTKSPGTAIAVFFIAVILVIIGTYCLFTAISIAILKALRKNKGYYYQARHFTAVSGMLYRMKQNAVGLANICILSTMVLVMLSTTICLYSGMEDSLRSMHPRNVEAVAGGLDDSSAAVVAGELIDAADSSGIPVKNRVMYRRVEVYATFDGKSLCKYDGKVSDAALIHAVFIPLNDYNSVFDLNETLASNEVLVCGELDADSFTMGGKSYTVKGRYDSFPLIMRYDMDNPTVAIVMQSTASFDAVYSAFKNTWAGGYELYFGADVENAADEPVLEAALGQALSDYEEGLGGAAEDESLTYTSSASNSRDDLMDAYGGLFFLGIFLGLMFTCAAALIMYYKQVSEGYEDRARFEIMQKVGMGPSEVRATIRSQVLTVFFLPLITAGIHVAFAFPLITTLFQALMLTNVRLFLICTLCCYGAFSVLYGVVYALTARTYYKIVRTSAA